MKIKQTTRGIVNQNLIEAVQKTFKLTEKDWKITKSLSDRQNTGENIGHR